MRVASLAVLILLGSVAAARAQGVPADCAAILGAAECAALGSATSVLVAPTGAAPRTPAAPPYTATFTTTPYGQANQAQLPSAYSNGVIPYDPTTLNLDPAFVSALGLDPKVPVTVQQFLQYWSSPNPSNGNYATD
jgi:hypothetical protein